MKLVLLDPGHGSNTPGKCAPDKSILEYAYVRDIAARVQKQLVEDGYDCRIIVPETYDVSLQERARRVNQLCKQYGSSNCLLLSIHLNAAGGDGKWKTARDWSGWVYTGASQNSKRAANILHDCALAEGLKIRKPMPNQKYWTANFYIIRKTSCPAVLTENLFQDNKEDVKILLSEEGKQKIVNLHVNAVKKYFAES